MGVVKSALAGTRLSCRDDTDFFFTMLFLTCVNYEHNCDTAGAADCMPALLFANHAIPVRHDIRILEDPCRRLKRNAVFPAVDAILLLVPHDDHVYIRNCSTSFRDATAIRPRQNDPQTQARLSFFYPAHPPFARFDAISTRGGRVKRSGPNFLTE